MTSLPRRSRRPGRWLTVLLCLGWCGCGNRAPSSPVDRPPPQRLASEVPSTEGEHTTPPAGMPTATGVTPSFAIIGAEAGLDFQRFDDITGQRRILETTGGGAALLDFDRDGWLDLFFTNGCRLPLRPDDRDTPSELFRHRPRLSFTRSTTAAGLTQYGYAQGCAVGDFDADGFDDLYVTAYGENRLWHNNGDGTFTDVTDVTGTAVPRWSTSAAFADVNGDGVLDLYVVNYLDESDRHPRLCPNPASPDGYEGCSPALFSGVDDVLFLGDGAGGFVDVSSASGISGHPGKGLGVVISDLDGDGTPEISVANDGEANFLFVRRGETAAAGAPPLLQFEERALLCGVALNERGFAQASMGIAAGDYDANGTIDLFLTHFFADTNTLYINDGGLSFRDGTRGSGLGETSRQLLGFGTLFVDYDNDRWLDLFVANGHVDDRTWMSPPQPYAMPPQLYRNNRNGTFTEVSSESGDYFRQRWLGRGVAGGDLDRDGKLDLAVSHQLAPSLVLHNETVTRSNSLTVQLVGTVSNRNGYGVKVELVGASPPLVRELSGGTSYQSAPAPELHVGLGEAEAATLRITWPSGTIDVQENLAAGTWIAVEGGPVLRSPLTASSTPP